MSLIVGEVPRDSQYNANNNILTHIPNSLSGLSYIRTISSAYPKYSLITILKKASKSFLYGF